VITPRRAFLVSIYAKDDVGVIEDLRTRRRLRVAPLSELAPELARWLRAEDGAPPAASDAEPDQERTDG
jgi:hypothetical protein